MSFILSEDLALRKALQGMVVHDQIADGSLTPRAVGVWFGQPDQELRAQAYPYVTIDLINVERDTQREHRGWTSANYLSPSGLANDEGFSTDIPIPVTLDYQITTFARHPRHDRELVTQLLFEKLPFRLGRLLLDDGTVRRMDVYPIQKRNSPEQAKRLFQNAITVRVSSEVAQGTIQQVKTVSSVVLDPTSPDNAGGRPGAPLFVGLE